MEKLRKIGLWAWNAKERVVLTLMVLLLGFRVYSLVNAQADDSGELNLSDPRAPMLSDADPPRPPEPPSPEPVIRLVRRSPFAYVPPQSRVNTTTTENDKDAEVKVLRVREVTGGQWSAQITAGGAPKMIMEGASFESYVLLSIDPDTGCCIIYSENSNSEFERCIEEN